MFCQKNPWTMLGHIDRCWLFTYQTPIRAAEKLLPPQLEPVTHNGYAFWNVVVSQLSGMRPTPLPEFVGLSYIHLAYRIYVRFYPKDDQPIEGLYFLRSDCDNRLMSLAGKLLTDFNFHTAPIEIRDLNDMVEIEVLSDDAPAYARIYPDRDGILPDYSAFDSLSAAKDFLKYKPNGISINYDGSANIVRITRNESEWQSRIIQVDDACWTYFNGSELRPEICYQVAPINYQWQRGEILTSR